MIQIHGVWPLAPRPTPMRIYVSFHQEKYITVRVTNIEQRQA